jgi:2-amino-4-hydroxy-6-hydroxymethyldihydropteridine diphosphokinase
MSVTNHPAVAAFVGIGGNLGQARTTVLAAMDALAQLPQTQLIASSPLYGSAPLGENADGPNYVNAVAQLRTTLSADALLRELHRIEGAFGRARSYKNAPRTLDLDILLYGDTVCHTDTLTLPHPRMHERAFVLYPLFDLKPDISWHNALGQRVSVRDLKAQIADQDISRLD